MDTNTDEQRRLVRLLDTLPERLALARSNRLPHHDFLEMPLTDEVARRATANPPPAAPRPPAWTHRCSCTPGTIPPRSSTTSSCEPS